MPSAWRPRPTRTLSVTYTSPCVCAPSATRISLPSSRPTRFSYVETPRFTRSVATITPTVKAVTSVACGAKKRPTAALVSYLLCP
jgi:hypothetical protein